MNKAGIYKITCIVDNMVYIGYSTNLKKREQNYKYQAVNTQTKLKKHFNKYGWVNFTFEIIEYCDIDKLKQKEKEWILKYDSYNNGLNGNEGGGGCEAHSDVTKQKISESRKGWVPSIERGIKIGNKNKNRKLSDEHKQKIGKSNSKPKPMFKGRISPNKGLKHVLTEEQKNKQKNKNGKKVKQFDKQGNFIKEWNSCSEAASFFNKNPSLITQCCKEKVKTAYNFVWKY